MGFFSKFKNFGKPSPEPSTPPPIPGPSKSGVKAVEFKMPHAGDEAEEGMGSLPAVETIDLTAEAENEAGTRVEIEIDLPTISLNSLLTKLVDLGGSDLHLESGNPPVFRIKGDIHFSLLPSLKNGPLRKMLFSLVSEREIKTFEKAGNLDFAYEIPGVARFRGNLLKQHLGVGAVFRVIPEEIPTLEQLKLPQVLKKIAMNKNGIVLVTGPTGSGKSTTMAAMINYINETRKAHIITIEDPIEFTHQCKKCLIDHRQVGHHTRSFPEALKAALREDPDIVLVGEMRDLETISLALTAAEMGVLVFGTLHTNNAAKTIDRIVDVFPAKQQEQVRAQLASSVKGIVAQQLMKTADGKGRVAAHEILIGTPGVGGLIREGKTGQLPSFIQMGKDEGMITMDLSLVSLAKKGKITKKIAYLRGIDKQMVANMLNLSVKKSA